MSANQSIIDIDIPLPIQIIIIILAFLSSFISLLVPALYFLQKKCRQHPTPLIAIISLLQALSNYNVVLLVHNIYKVQNFIHVKDLFDIMTFHKPSQPSNEQFCQINFIIYILLELLSISYNICFSADLLVTLQLPFYSGKKRMKFYHLFCFLFTAVSLAFCFTEAEDICDEQLRYQSVYRIPKSFLIALIVFYILSLVIMLLSFRKREEAQIRTKYIKHHRIIIICLVLVWLVPLTSNFLILAGFDTKEATSSQSTAFQIMNIISFFSLVLSGGIVNIVRFSTDKYLWSQIKKMLFDRRKKPEPKNKNKEESDQWNIPLANAVSMFQNQQVISNIIQIVQETCILDESEEQKQQNLQMSFPNNQYQFSSSIMDDEKILAILKNGSIDQLKKIVKINKKLQMLCTSERQEGSATEKSIFSIVTQQNKKQNNQMTIKVKSFADPIFIVLREKDGINGAQLRKTLDISLNADNIRRSRQSLGASGSFFFFSFDHKLVIKTIPQNEVQALLQLLPYYYEHIHENPSSLLTHIYGLFSVQIAGISKINFIMMENSFEIFDKFDISYKKYDLKGSTVSREVKGRGADVFKDINYFHSDDVFLLMPKERKEELFQQIQRDITLLKKHNLMDYSLLVGVAKVKRKRQLGVGNWRYITDGYELTNRVYSLSLIDYLQQFNMNKYMELKLKKVFKGGGDISSIDTDAYYKRFLNFIKKIVVVYND